VKAHAEADRLIKGTGWEDGKGCAIGCTLEAYQHDRYPVELGIPEVLAYVEDRIFEGLPNAQAMTWPQRFLEAIRPGADLENVHKRLIIWNLQQVEPNALPDGKVAIAKVIQVFRDWIDGKFQTPAALESAARSAESEARSAAWSAWSAAQDDYYIRLSEKLLSLLAEC
jgi:hypothetical protein